MKHMIQDANIAIFAADVLTNTNPSLTALLEALHGEGATLDFYCSDNRGWSSPDSLIQSNLNSYRFPYYLCIDYSKPGRFIRSLSQCITLEHVRAWKRMQSQKYDLVIGIDDLGLIAGHQLTIESNCPLVFLSYEISFSNELKFRAEKHLKQRAIKASSKIDLAIVQDKGRSAHLVCENQLNDVPITYLPVSPAQRAIAPVPNSQYLRDKFNIPENKTILLHSGSFAEWTAAPQLIESLPALDKDVVLVIHTRWNAKTKRNRFLKRIEQLSFSNVVLSLDALNELEYAEMVSSADVGLVIYNHSGVSRNIQEIGLSSGKFSTYTRAALPIVTWNNSFYEKMFETYQCGINVADLSDITDAVQTISNQYDTYSRESARLFSEKLDFDRYWPDIKEACGHLIT